MILDSGKLKEIHMIRGDLFLHFDMEVKIVVSYNSLQH
jgi:hypothetical protein